MECQLWTHPGGWELRLYAAGEFVHAQLYDSLDEVLATTEQWKHGLLDKEWEFDD